MAAVGEVVDGDAEHHVFDALLGLVADPHRQRLAGQQMGRPTAAGMIDLDRRDADLEAAPLLLGEAVCGVIVSREAAVLEPLSALDLLGVEPLAERADGLARRAERDEVAVVEHSDARADAAHQVGRVGHDHDGAALVLELMHTVEALALEGLVADGEHLVDEQNVGIDVHGDREAEAHVHARGVVLHLLVDEPLELGELDDVVEPRVDVGALEPEHAAFMYTF